MQYDLHWEKIQKLKSTTVPELEKLFKKCGTMMFLKIVFYTIPLLIKPISNKKNCVIVKPNTE